VARELWVAIRFFGLEWIMPRKVIEVLDSWRGQVGRQNILEAWKMAPLCLMWCIWRERNVRSFEDCGRSVEQLKSIMLGWRR